MSQLIALLLERFPDRRVVELHLDAMSEDDCRELERMSDEEASRAIRDAHDLGMGSFS